MINGLRVFLRSAGGIVITHKHTLTGQQHVCFCVGRSKDPNRKSQARHYHRNIVLERGGGACVTPEEQFVCGAACEL